MRVITRDITLDGRAGEHTHDFYTDTHLGNIATDEKRLKRHIADSLEIAEKTSYSWSDNGDSIDGILPGDRRFRLANLPNWAIDQLKGENLIKGEWDHYKLVFAPLKPYAMAIIQGDGKHDNRLDVSNAYKETCDWFGVPNDCGAITYLRFRFRRGGTSGTTSVIQGIIAHGAFAGRKDGGKINNIRDLYGQFPDADFIILGHGHSLFAIPNPAVGLSGESIYDKIRWYGMAGSYLLSYPQDRICYAEQRLYPPVALGHLRMTLKPFSDDKLNRIKVECIL